MSTNPSPIPFKQDLIEMPGKSLNYRGIRISRSTLIRLSRDGKIKTAAIRFTGTAQRRRVILMETLDAFIDQQLSDQE